jgi:hypothetical protein
MPIKLIPLSIVLLLAVAAAPCARAQAVILEPVYADEFLDGASWSGSFYWNVDNNPIPGYGGTGLCLNFNDSTGVYPGYAQGAARSPNLYYTGRTVGRIDFACRYDTETTGAGDDVRRVRVVDVDTDEILIEAQLVGINGAINCGPMNAWHVHQLDVTPFVGRVLAVEFFFDAIDADNQLNQGWFIDSFNAVADDITAPDPVFGFELDPYLLDQAVLRWNSPVWDGLQLVNPLSQAELRYGTTPITAENWFDGPHVVMNLGFTQTPSSGHVEVIQGLDPLKKHYFAIRVKDLAGNWSELSEVLTWGKDAPEFPPLTTASGDSDGKKVVCGAAGGSPDGRLMLLALVLVAIALARRTTSRVM